MNKIVGNNLKMLRKAKNMSQEEVADILKISQSAYARMERGESASWAAHFNRICQAFEIVPEELIKKELGTEIYASLIDPERLTELRILSVYRKIIKKYELEIEDLKTIIKYLNRVKTKKASHK
ncbi:helix-turn-helix domain-containing protein [Flavobacterium sp. MDT1-60]|uniref:helix-turn-helix domain-containing protein n=1 Tax=Flavobacterium sp. MDT1-60 TaxID=1979344 RepID=UPI00178360C7|nr:helix-turn-helix transcriptional regulator [Flavobacterium sp. MDT1-60]QOG03550.1 helix-turn-helix transcriptional regulator [Flavobacterium sp. MDT1-60]